jgi:hypothetical protein
MRGLVDVVIPAATKDDAVGHGILAAAAQRLAAGQPPQRQRTAA